MDANGTQETPIQTIQNGASTPEGDDNHHLVGKPTPEVGWGIDKGVTRENNEDSLATVTLDQASESASQTIGVYAVADGMGGEEAGEVASKLAIRRAVQEVVGHLAEVDEAMPENYREWLSRAVEVANQMVREAADSEGKKMGTTLVMAVVVGNDVHIANVGDSRAYIISPQGIRQITRDQSLVQALVDSGALTPEQAIRNPRRNILTQAVGSQDEISTDLYNETLQDDESILLCSDGVWDMLGDQEIWKIVRAAETPTAACQLLVDACNAKGARDNIAAVLVRPRVDNRVSKQ